MEFLSITKNNTKTAKNIVLAVLFWLGIGLVLGLLAGVVGALFYHAIASATTIRRNNEFLIYFLPLGGIATVFIYNLLNVKGQNTNDCFKEIKGKKRVSLLLWPAVFVASFLTHLFGGSAGKEGAALQIGGSLAKGVSKFFKLNDNATRILIYAGLGALFAAVFATPFTAAAFALTVIVVFKINFSAVLVTFTSTFSAYFIALGLGVKPEKYEIDYQKLDFLVVLKLLFLVAVCGIVGGLFAKALQ